MMSSRNSSWRTTWWRVGAPCLFPSVHGDVGFSIKACAVFFTDNMPCHFTAAFSAGLCTTVVASPVDVVKTRYMNSVPGQYGGALNCAATMLIKEGPTAFYKGWVWVKNENLKKLPSFAWSPLSVYSFMPSFLRLLSWNIVMFVSYEQFKRGFLRLQQSWSSLQKPIWCQTRTWSGIADCCGSESPKTALLWSPTPVLFGSVLKVFPVVF